MAKHRRHHASARARAHERKGEERFHEEHPFGHHVGRPTERMEHHLRKEEHHDRMRNEEHERRRLNEEERGHMSSHSRHRGHVQHHSDMDGMARYPKRGNIGGLGDEYYAGYDPRRMLEKRDGDMIQEDHHAIANLPPAAFMREWPGHGYESGKIRADDIEGIDLQMDNDVRDIRSNRMHNKA